jgi:hypothetical protein
VDGRRSKSEICSKRIPIVNTQAAHLAFALFFVSSLAYSGMAYPAALAKDAVNEKTIDAIRNCKEQFRIFIDVGHYQSAPGATSARGKTDLILIFA